MRSAGPAVLLGVMVLVLAVASPAWAGGTADLSVEANVIKSKGAERTVRVTLTNSGPDEAYAGDPYEGFETGYNIQFSMKGATLLGTSIPCSDSPYISTTPPDVDRDCGIGRALAAGASRSVDVRVRVTPAGQRSGYFTGGMSVVESQGEDSPGFRYASTDPDFADRGENFPWATPPGCVVRVKNPQRARARLQVRVVAPAGGGCTAKLKNAKLTIGKKKYVFIKKRPQRKVAAGKTWKLGLPYGAGTLSTIRNAIQKGTKVSASVEFDIDGTTRRGKARLK